jgi:hypothetical protein
MGQYIIAIIFYIKKKHPICYIDNGWPENILDPIVCGEYGHCNPCDFRDMEVLPLDESILKPVLNKQLIFFLLNNNRINSFSFYLVNS